MHQLDHALGEFEAGIDALESNEFEFENEGEFPGELSGEQETVFDEVQEMELAAELLQVQNEEEMEQFLGSLISKAGSAIGKIAKSPIGHALGGALKNVAKTALPIAGAALGNMVLPGVGGMIGGKLASAAGGLFGLELEGLSPEDREFEVARRVVRLAGESVRQATAQPPYGHPEKIAKDAVLAAAVKHSPGLASRASAGGCSCGKGQGGYGYTGYGPARDASGRFVPRGTAGGYPGGGYWTGGYPGPRRNGGYASGGYATQTVPVRSGGYGGGYGGAVPGSKGTWYRCGNSIVLTGA